MGEFAFHPAALADLDDIWSYLAQSDLAFADRMIAEILAALEILPALPQRGHRRPDITRRPLRFVWVRDYLVAYAPDESPLWVIAVLHGRRSPRLMASLLRGRD